MVLGLTIIIHVYTQAPCFRIDWLHFVNAWFKGCWILLRRILSYCACTEWNPDSNNSQRQNCDDHYHKNKCHLVSLARQPLLPKSSESLRCQNQSETENMSRKYQSYVLIKPYIKGTKALSGLVLYGLSLNLCQFWKLGYLTTLQKSWNTLSNPFM